MGAHDLASRVGKAATEGRCVFTGLIGVDAAHLFSAGDYPELADIPENIFAMVRKIHSVPDASCFDFTYKYGVRKVRPVAERIWLLRTYGLDELKHIINKKLRVVALWCEAKNIDFPEPQRPADYDELVYQERLK